MRDNYKISLAIAEILIEIVSPLSSEELGIVDRLGPFFGEPNVPLGRVDLIWEESNNQPDPVGKLIYDPGSVWKMYRSDKYFYAALSYYYESQKEQIKAVLCANRTWDKLTLIEQRHGKAWQSLLSIGAGELILRTNMLFTNGLVFHASALDDNGKGIVFVGHSGAGKSTQANLWSKESGVIVINHDRVAIRVGKTIPMCYGLPWGGKEEVTLNHSVPLSALIILEQSQDNLILPLSPTAAAPFLMTCTYLPYWDQTLMSLAMSNLNSILTNVPVYRLFCRPEKEVIPLVRSVL